MQTKERFLQFIFDQTQEKGNALGMVEEAALLRPKKVLRRMQDGDTVEHQYDSVL